MSWISNNKKGHRREDMTSPLLGEFCLLKSITVVVYFEVCNACFKIQKSRMLEQLPWKDWVDGEPNSRCVIRSTLMFMFVFTRTDLNRTPIHVNTIRLSFYRAWLNGKGSLWISKSKLLLCWYRKVPEEARVNYSSLIWVNLSYAMMMNGAWMKGKIKH